MVNIAPGFQQTLKNNQNFWAHCRLIICHNLLAPLAETTKYTHNAKHTKESSCSQPEQERVSLILPLVPPFLCLVIRLYTFVKSAHSSRATVESWLCLAYPTTGILMNMSLHSRRKELPLSNATITAPFKKLQQREPAIEWVHASANRRR